MLLVLSIRLGGERPTSRLEIECLCLAIAASATILAPMLSLLSPTPPMSSPSIQGSHLPRVPPWGFPSSQPIRLLSYAQRPSQGKPCLFMGPAVQWALLLFR